MTIYIHTFFMRFKNLFLGRFTQFFIFFLFDYHSVYYIIICSKDIVLSYFYNTPLHTFYQVV